MRKHYFRKIFLLYFLVLILSVIFVELYVTKVVRTNYIDELRSSLAVQAGLVSEHISLEAPGGLDDYCRQVKKRTGSRITILDVDGMVLGDSDNDSSMMDNHLKRSEIRKSLRSETGWAIRYSDTLKYDFLYVARKIVRSGSAIGFIRLAVPLKDVNRNINTLRLQINLVVILLILLSGTIIIWQTERIRKFVLRIVDYAGALSHGLFRKKLHIEGAGEFSELAESLNNMALELEDTIEKRDSETNRLSVILKNIPDALLLINMNDVIELSNNTAKELFGSPELDGRPYIEVVRSPDFLDLIEKVKQDRMTGSADLVVDFPEERHLSVSVSPLSYRIGELAGVVAIFHDTTQMRKLEQMRKDFVANVSHEIKTPVTAIQGFAETLLDGAMHDTENAGKFLETIKTHSERLNRLVEDLLTISRIELGVIKIDKSRLDLPDVIDNISGALVVQAAKKGLDIRKSFGAGDNTADADRHRVEQVLLNLLDNAIKFTEEGEIETGTAREGARDYFYVRDTGSGIPEKYLSRVGERFFRVDPSRSRELGGTGLGLAIVKHIVIAHGWEMKIESVVGKGTTVKVFYQ
ncbi:MAG: ATP-binding protein [Nitrospirota bacterium]